MPRPCAVASANSGQTFFVAASVKLHGARPWLQQEPPDLRVERPEILQNPSTFQIMDTLAESCHLTCPLKSAESCHVNRHSLPLWRFRKTIIIETLKALGIQVVPRSCKRTLSHKSIALW